MYVVAVPRQLGWEAQPESGLSRSLDVLDSAELKGSRDDRWRSDDSRGTKVSSHGSVLESFVLEYVR